MYSQTYQQTTIHTFQQRFRFWVPPPVPPLLSHQYPASFLSPVPCLISLTKRSPLHVLRVALKSRRNHLLHDRALRYFWRLWWPLSGYRYLNIQSYSRSPSLSSMVLPVINTPHRTLRTLHTLRRRHNIARRTLRRLHILCSRTASAPTGKPGRLRSRTFRATTYANSVSHVAGETQRYHSDTTRERQRQCQRGFNSTNRVYYGGVSNIHQRQRLHLESRLQQL